VELVVPVPPLLAQIDGHTQTGRQIEQSPWRAKQGKHRPVSTWYRS
jgi:hypothetical protein